MPADGLVLTPEAIAEIAARCRAATPGPWIIGHWPASPDYMVATASQKRLMTVEEHTCEQNRADAWFVANAREDAPRLLAAAEQVPVLLAEVARLREALRDIEQVCWGRDGMVSGLRARIITRCRDALGGEPE